LNGLPGRRRGSERNERVEALKDEADRRLFLGGREASFGLFSALRRDVQSHTG